MRRLIEAKIPLEGASDHGVSEALYLRDPDDNGVELYWDRPKQAWPLTADGKLAMFTRRLDLTNLLAENDMAAPAQVDAPLFEPSRNSYLHPPPPSRSQDLPLLFAQGYGFRRSARSGA